MACKIARAEGKPRPTMPESTSKEEEDASDAEAHLPGEDEAGTGADSPPVYQEAGDEDAPVAPREARPAPGLLADSSLAGAERRSPTPAAERRSPTPAAGGRSSTPTTERRSPLPATGEGVPTPTMSTGGDGSAASAGTPAQTASRSQADPGAVDKDAAPLAPTKALKTGARATPHSAPQPPPVVATESVIPVVQLPDSSEEFGDSRDIDPAAAASAADKITEFTSDCAEMLDEGTSEGPQHGAIIQSGVPPEFLHDERKEESVWQAQIEAGSQILNHLDRALELH
ncbi:mucin-1-like [Panicum virgatum]|uniref:mucin-1-like n=1 Tax=Panicum virgatum TaxID=38727 RepID=UPI0019D5663D|nr:mucin-1-like [Panicum virgatum]